jgi:DNA-binding IclR family transcriptional regulator
MRRHVLFMRCAWYRRLPRLEQSAYLWHDRLSRLTGYARREWHWYGPDEWREELPDLARHLYAWWRQEWHREQGAGRGAIRFSQWRPAQHIGAVTREGER